MQFCLQLVRQQPIGPMRRLDIRRYLTLGMTIACLGCNANADAAFKEDVPDAQERPVADLPAPPNAVSESSRALSAATSDTVRAGASGVRIADTVFVIPTELDDPEVYYPWITQLSFGPRSWVGTEETDEIQAVRHRVAVTTSEIYNSLHMERITWGMEGCCAEVQWSYSWRMWEMSDWFGIRGEVSGVVVTGWRGANEFVFSLHGRRFVVAVGEGPRFTIEEQ